MQVYFTFMSPCIVTNFFTIKPTRRTNLPNLFWHETLHVSGSFFAHHQEFFTLHLALVYVTHVCKQLSSRTRMELLDSCLQTCTTITNVECTVKNSWWWAEELPEICRVPCQNKFGKLVRLVGFIVKKCRWILYRDTLKNNAYYKTTTLFHNSVQPPVLSTCMHIVTQFNSTLNIKHRYFETLEFNVEY